MQEDGTGGGIAAVTQGGPGPGPGPGLHRGAQEGTLWLPLAVASDTRQHRIYGDQTEPHKVPAMPHATPNKPAMPSANSLPCRAWVLVKQRGTVGLLCPPCPRTSRAAVKGHTSCGL